MPETKVEWIVLAAGVLVIGLIGFLIATSKPSGGTTPQLPAASVPPLPKRSIRSTPFATSTPVVRLVLTAAGGDCWLLARSHSRSGPVLFSGIMRRGTSRALVGRTLWLRLGAAANVVARLNGAPLKMPRGTATVLVTHQGVRTLSGG